MRLPLILALTLLLAPVCRADDSLALAGQLLDIENTPVVMHTAFESTFKASLDRMKAQGMPQELVDQIYALADQYFAENFNWTTLRPQFAQIYANAFTEKELADLVAFYTSPTGKKAIAVMPGLFNQASAIGLAQLKAKTPEFQQKVVALIQAYQAKHAAAAPSVTPTSAATPAPAATTAPATPAGP